MMKVNGKDNSVDFSFYTWHFEKFGERRLFSRGEIFVRTDIIVIEESVMLTAGIL